MTLKQLLPLLALVALLFPGWSQAATTTALVPAGSAWKYRDTGANLGTAWRTNSFNDSAWASGPAPLGYGEMNTGVWPRTTNSFGSDANNKFITTYYRRTFSVTNAAGVSMLQLRLLRDDGAVVYLNGVEVFRSNMPTGAVSHTTLASGAVGNADETNFFPGALVLRHLREGTNLLAVEVHQVATNSSDLAFDLALNAIRSDARETWRGLKYGIFSHYVYAFTFGTPDTNGVAPGSVDECANNFNAARYADDCAAAGAEYVVWTAWHANMVPLFPSRAMQKYHGTRHSQRDTVGDMIDAVKARGLRVYLYTHPYQPLTGDLVEHNNFINEIYAEVIDRYGDRIDGLWIDENQIQANQDSLVDYKRLLRTIRERAPHLVTMQNGGQMYTVDMGGPEVVGSWNFGWSECMYNLVTGGLTSEDMLRTVVLEAAANFEGGGVHWSIDGVGLGGLSETTRIFALGRYLAPIRASVLETKPSTSFPPPYKDGRTVSYSQVDWVATAAMDDTKEFIHVLKSPGSNTLTLPTPVDGKIFTNATLLASLQAGAATQQVLNAPVTLVQTPRGLQLTLTGTNTWSALDAVIRLDVASLGGAGLVNDASASVSYAGGSWTSARRRGLGEFAEDAHTATANGDSFTFTFSGTDVSFISSRGADRGGVDLYIDGVWQTNVNLAVGATNRDVVFTKSGLPRGAHTLRGVKTSGALLVVDAFQVTELVNDSDPDMSAGFPDTYSLGHGAAGYNGLWQPGYNGAAWITPGVGYYPTPPTAGSPPTSDYFEFTFYGTAAQCFLTSAHGCGNYYLLLDGVFQLNLGVCQGSVQTFTVTNLPLATHTIKGITWKGTTDPIQPGVNGFTVTRPDLWHYQTNRNRGELGDDVHYTDVNPGTFRYTFTGSGVEVICTRDPDSRMAFYGVSGMGLSTGARRQNYLETTLAGTSVFSLPNLTPGTHTVSVQHNANTSGLNFSFVRLTVDALRIYKGESLSSTPLLWGATGAGGSGTWNVATTANWNDGGQAIPWQDFGGVDCAARFQGTAGTVSLSTGIKVNRLLFHTTGYTLQNNTLTLNGVAPTITLASNVTTTISSTIAGSAGLRKEGAGLLILSGANTYTGGTTVSEGTLRVNGSLAGAAVNVTGGTLAGTGTIGGAVTVQAGATLAPGVTLGTMTINSALTLAAGSRTEVDLNAATGTNDLVRGLTIATFGGTLMVNNLAGTVTNGQRFKLFNAAAASGNFTNITPAPGPGLAWSFQPASGTLIATQPTMPVTFVPAGATWRYFDGTNNLGTTWRSPAFNDSGWSNGAARLGYGNDGEVTKVASNRQWTTYFRRPFFVPNPTNLFSVTARLTRDDAAVVYLNGTEIWRDTNITSGSISYTTPALSALGGADETTWVALALLPAQLSLLVPGDNLIAAEVHNQSLSSSDLGFDFEMTGTLFIPPPPSLSIANSPGGLTLSSSADAGYFTVTSTTNLTPPVVWTPLTNAATLTNNEWRVTLPAATNGQRFYRLQAP
jgi:autotransporter-associated beta strand protein